MRGLPDIRVVRQAQGFTLLEVLVATAVVSCGVMAVAQFSVLATSSTIAARDLSYEGVLAAQKLAELQTIALPGLNLTGADAWMRGAGAAEYLDAGGAVVSSGGFPPGSARYVRRWSITPLVVDPTGGVAIQVSTGRMRRAPVTGSVEDARPHETARVVAIRTGTVP